jgi:hypothetical protein
MGVILMFFFFLSFCFVFFWDGPTNWRHLRYNAQMSGCSLPTVHKRVGDRRAAIC